MDSLLSITEAISLLAGFSLAMVVLVLVIDRGRPDTADRFLVANRNLHWFNAAMSIAVTWVWAPAVFITSLQSYTNSKTPIFQTMNPENTAP